MQVQLILHEGLANGLPAIHHFARVLAKLLALASQADRAIVAHEQLGAEFVLELLDAAAERSSRRNRS